MGLSVDIFSNTPRVAATSMTLLGLLQPYVLELFMQRESDDDLQRPSSPLVWHAMSTTRLLLTFVYCLVFFTIETFTFFNWMQWLLSIGGSTLLSAIMIVVVENLRKN
jgi:hypothetical protein